MMMRRNRRGICSRGPRRPWCPRAAAGMFVNWPWRRSKIKLVRAGRLRPRPLRPSPRARRVAARDGQQALARVRLYLESFREQADVEDQALVRDDVHVSPNDNTARVSLANLPVAEDGGQRRLVAAQGAVPAASQRSRRRRW